MMVASIFTACPSCERRVSEITAAGICPRCKSAFAKEHTRHVEGPARWTAADFQISTRRQGENFDEHGACLAVEESHVEPEAPTVHDLVWQDTATALREVLRWVWRREGNDRLQKPKTALLRLATVAAVVDPLLMDNRTFKQIGAMLGVGKACISKTAVTFTDRFGLHFRRLRPKTARENMARAAKLHPPCHPRKAVNA
jgi:hypothetical protein